MKLKMKIVALTTALFLTGSASSIAESVSAERADYTKMSPEQLAEYLIFDAKGFRLNQEVQEGGVAKQRLIQDELQKICTPLRGERPTGDTATKVMEMARASYNYPDEIKLGDWKIGRQLAWSGFGWRVGHRTDDHAQAMNGPGGNCYNCHQLATDRTGGTIGPSLTGYGKMRGTSDATLKYTYEMIYNPHAYFPCTNMPRMGAKGNLTQEQISHIMAYLLDPESPVNK